MSEHVTTFLLTQRACNEHKGYDRALEDARDAAAKALLADAAGRHHIEERSVIWLCLDENGRWGLDSPSDDGYPLEGYDDGPINSECEHGDELDAECAAVRDAAALIELPTLRDLLTLLQDYLGVRP